mmetsp:Transcript_38444/g.83985  ORF Transcript_38444/g.83985 Transcript_38444/m.83985 type:complete len:250 (-) Transcript_38444:787-1536(-)
MNGKQASKHDGPRGHNRSQRSSAMVENAPHLPTGSYSWGPTCANPSYIPSLACSGHAPHRRLAAGVPARLQRSYGTSQSTAYSRRVTLASMQRRSQVPDADVDIRLPGHLLQIDAGSRLGDGSHSRGQRSQPGPQPRHTRYCLLERLDELRTVGSMLCLRISILDRHAGLCRPPHRPPRVPALLRGPRLLRGLSRQGLPPAAARLAGCLRQRRPESHLDTLEEPVVEGGKTLKAHSEFEQLPTLGLMLD